MDGGVFSRQRDQAERATEIIEPSSSLHVTVSADESKIIESALQAGHDMLDAVAGEIAREIADSVTADGTSAAVELRTTTKYERLKNTAARLDHARETLLNRRHS